MWEMEIATVLYVKMKSLLVKTVEHVQ